MFEFLFIALAVAAGVALAPYFWDIVAVVINLSLIVLAIASVIALGAGIYVAVTQYPDAVIATILVLCFIGFIFGPAVLLAVWPGSPLPYLLPAGVLAAAGTAAVFGAMDWNSVGLLVWPVAISLILGYLARGVRRENSTGDEPPPP